MFGYPASANRLFAASVFRRLPSGSVASRSLSCCGNILWFEKCNTSEYAAGGHRPTRSDAAKRLAVSMRRWRATIVKKGSMSAARLFNVIASVSADRRAASPQITEPNVNDTFPTVGNGSNWIEETIVPDSGVQWPALDRMANFPLTLKLDVLCLVPLNRKFFRIIFQNLFLKTCLK
ncbi:unnamed protein product [Nesidiocoris tenuis]|uniref:Uncharacterized protein n=2 Tax=Nesidiocoris tenuis TaxID=355587 RepID=A0A6H5GYA5_9HEMI|nr:unnamed protein product [Nesidiocoris tenuis]